MRRAQAARERRARILTWTATGAVLAGVIGGGWYLVEDTRKKDAARERAAAAPVPGEKSWRELGREHVATPVKYAMSPAVGGDHAQAWMNCDGDVYGTAIPEPSAVHALEHGAVWITHNGKAAAKDVDRLTSRVKRTPYSLMSPYAEQSSPIVLSAWGKQLHVESAADPRIEKFLDKYVQGAQTPEPGAACTGGIQA
ncbi:DUF3105 domain-containing protein [Streptomyces sp. NA04227]|uniref:DUF3105 domain-containing protein n=1 Tax=Streptomyces sp. NA04227 TaxID=2742136 RepID=UPI0020CA5662|nr:DUF3105 domain-containing protein [Streptomyces sp. NA04227]